MAGLESFIPSVGFVNDADTAQNLIPGVGYSEGSPSAAGAATAVTMTGPSSGVVNVSSTNFTISVDSPSITGTLIVTPASNHTGTFSPTTVSLTTGSPSATVTFLPTVSGAHTLSNTNDGGLSNSATLPYTVIPAVTVTLVTSPTDPTPRANLSSLRWAWWDILDPDVMDTTLATDAGAAETTDASGVLTITLTNSTKTGLASGTGTLMVWDVATTPTKVAVGKALVS